MFELTGAFTSKYVLKSETEFVSVDKQGRMSVLLSSGVFDTEFVLMESSHDAHIMRAYQMTGQFYPSERQWILNGKGVTVYLKEGMWNEFVVEIGDNLWEEGKLAVDAWPVGV